MSRSSRSRDKSWSFVPWYNTGDLYLPQEDPYQNLWQMSTTDSRRSGSSRKYYDGASLSSYSHQGSAYAYDNYAYIDSGYVSSMKSFKTGSYSLEGGRKFRSHQRKKRCAIIAVILCVLALIAVAIGISIYLNDQKPLVKTTESTTQAPTTEVTTQAATATTTQATTTYTAPLLPVYGGNLKLNRTWDPNLNDQTSTEYQNLKNTMEDALDATYSNYSENFNYSVVTGFEQGSIDIKYILVFIVVTASPEEIQNALVVAISSGQNNSPVTAVLAEAIPESVVIEQQTAAPPTTTASATTTSTTAATTTVSTTTTPTTTVSTTTTPTTTVSTTTTSTTTVSTTTTPTTTVSTTTTPTTTVSTTTTPTTSSSAVTSTATPVDSTTTSTLTTPSTTPTTIASSPKTSTSETSASTPKLSTRVSVSTTATPGTTTPMSTTTTVIQTTTVNPCTDVDSLETVALPCVGKYTLQITDAKNLTEFCGVMDLILSCVIIDVYNQTKVTCTEQDGNHLIETYGDTIKTLLSLPYNPKDCLVTVSTTAVTPSMTTPPAQPCQNMSLIDIVAPTCLTASLIYNLTNAGSEAEFCSAIRMYGICIKSSMLSTYRLNCTEDDMMYWLKVSAQDIKSHLSTKYDPLICLVTSSTTAPSSTTPTISNCSDVSWLKQQMDENCGSAMEMFSRTRDQQDRCRIYTDLLGCLHVNWDLKNIKCSITSVAETIATEGKFSMLVPSAPNFNASICYNGTIPLPVTTPLVSPYCKQPDVVRFVSSYDCHANLSFTAEANPVTLCRFYQMKLGCVIYNLREIIAAEKCSLDDTRHTFDEYLSQNMPNIGMSINLTTCHSIPTNTCSSFMYNDIEYGYSCGRLLGNGIGIPVLRDTPGLLCNVTGIAYECVYRGSKDHHNLVCDKYQMAKDIVPWLQAVQALYIPDSSDSVVIDYNTCLEKAANKTDFGEGKQEEDSQALVLYGAPCLEPLSQISLSDYLVCSIVEQSIPCWQNALYESTGDTYDNKAIKDAIGKEIPLLKTITGKNLTSCVNNTDGTCFPFTQIATDHNLGSAAGNCFGFYGLLEVFNTTSPVINNTQACGVFDHGVSCMRKNISQYGFSCSFEQMREIMILYITAANEALNRKPLHDIAKCPVMDETSFCTDDLSFTTTVIVANCSAALQFGGTDPSDSCSKYISFRDCLYSAIVYNTASPAYFRCTTQEAKSLIKNNIDWIEESTKSNVNRSCLDIVDPCFSPASLETDKDLAGASASCFGYFQYLIELNMLTPSGQQINSSQACRVFDHGVSCMSKTIAPFGYSCSHASVRLTMSTAYSYYLTSINKASLFDPGSCQVMDETSFCTDDLSFTTTVIIANCSAALQFGGTNPSDSCSKYISFRDCLYSAIVYNTDSPAYFRCTTQEVKSLIKNNIDWIEESTKSNVNRSCLDIVDPCFSPASLETDKDLAGASASCFGYFQYLIELNMLTPSGQQINSSQACRVFDHGVSCMSKTIAPFGYSCSHASVRLTMSTAYSYYLTSINKASLFDPASCQVSAEGNFCSDNLTFTTTTLVATCHTNLEGGDSDPVRYCQSSFEGAFKTCLYTTYGNPVSPSYFRCSHEDVDKLIRSNIKWLQQFVKSGVNLTYCINLKVLSLSMELNTTFHPDLYNKSSTLYQDFTKNITEGLEGLLPNSEVKINEFRPGSVIVHLEVTSFSQIFTVDVIGQTLNSSAPTSLPPLRHYIPGSLLQLQDVTPSVTPPTVNPSCRNMSIVDVVSPPCLTANLTNTILNANSQTEYCSALEMYGICVRNKMFTTYGWTCTEDDMMYWLRVSAEDVKNAFPKYDPLICLSTEQTTVPVPTTPPISSCSDVSWLKQQMDEYCGSAMEMFSRTHDQQDRCRIYTDVLGCLHVNWDLRSISCSITSVAKVITAVEFSKFVPSASNFNSSICYDGMIPLPVTTPLVAPYCKQPDVVTYAARYDCHANLSFTAGANDETICRFYQMKLGCVMHSLREIRAAEKCSLDDTRHTFDKYLSRNMPDIGMSINLTTCHSIPTNTCSSFMYNDIEYGYSCGRLLGNGIGIPVLRDTPGLLCNVTGIAYECVYRGSKDHHNLVCDKYQMAKDIVPWLQAVQALYIPDSSDSVVIDYNTCLEKAANKTDFGEGKQEEDSQALVLYGAPCLEPLSQISLSDYLVCSIVEQSIPCWQNALYESTGDTYDNKAIKDAIGKEIPLLKTITGKNLTSCVNNTDGTCFPFTQIATDHNLGSAAGNCFGFYGLLEVFNTTSPVINNTQACGVFDHGVSCMRKNISQYGFSCSFEQMREIMILYITAANEALNRKPVHDIAKCPVMDETSFCTDDLSFKTVVIVANCSAALQFGGTDPSDSCSKYISFRDCLYSAIVYNTASPAYFRCTTQEAKSLIKNNIDWIEESTKSDVNRSCLDIVDPCFSPASLETDKDLAGASASCFGYFQYLIELNMLTPSGQQINSSQACRVFDHGVSCMSKTIAPFGYSCSHASVRLTMSTAYSYYLTAINKASLFDPGSCQVMDETSFCTDDLSFTTTVIIANCSAALQFGGTDPSDSCSKYISFRDCLYSAIVYNTDSPAYFRCTTQEVKSLIKNNIDWIEESTKSNVNRSCLDIVDPCFSPASLETDKDLAGASASCFGYFQYLIGLNMLTPSGQQINSSQACRVFDHGVSCMSKTIAPFGYSCSHASVRMTMSTAYSYYLTSINKSSLFDPASCQVSAEGNFCSDNLTFTTTMLVSTCHTNLESGDSDPVGYCQSSFEDAFKTCLYKTYGDPVSPSYFRCSHEDIDKLIRSNIKWLQQFVKSGVNLTYCIHLKVLSLSMELNTTFHPDLYNKSSTLYQDFAKNITEGLEGLLPNSEVKINEFGPGSVIVHFEVTSFSQIFTVDVIGQTLNSSAPTSLPPLRHYIPGSLLQLQDVTPSVTPPTVNPSCRNMSIVDVVSPPCLTANLTNTILNANSQTEYCSALEMYGICVRNKMFTTYGWTCTEDDMMYWLRVSAEDVKNAFPKYDPLICLSTEQTTVPVPTTPPISSCSDVSWLKQQMDEYCGSAMEMFSRTHDQQDRCRIYTDVLGCLHVNWDLRSINCSITSVAKVITAVEFSKFVPSASNFNSSICYNGTIPLPVTTPLVAPYCKQPDVVTYAARYDCHANLSFTAGANDETICRFYQMKLGCVMYSLREIRAAEKCSLDDTRHAFDKYLSRNMPDIGMSINLTMCHSIPTNTCSTIMYNDTEYGIACTGLVGIGMTIPVLRDTPELLCNVTGIAFECLYRGSKERHNLVCDKYQMAKDIVPWFQAVQAFSTPDPSDSVTIDFNTCLEKAANKTDFGEGKQEEDSQALVLYGASCLSVFSQTPQDPNTNTCSYLEHFIPCWQRSIYEFTGIQYDYTAIRSLTVKEIPLIKAITGKDLSACVNHTECFPITSNETAVIFQKASEGCLGYYGILEHFNTSSPVVKINNTQACRVFDHGVSCLRKNISNYGGSCSFEQMRETVKTFFANVSLLHDVNNCPVSAEVNFCDDNLTFTTSAIVSSCYTLLAIGDTDTLAYCTSNFEGFKGCMYNAMSLFTSPSYYQCSHGDVDKLIRNNIKWLQQFVLHGANLTQCINLKVLSLSMKLNTTFHPDLYNASSTRYSDFAKNITEGMETIFKGSEIKITGFMEGSVIVYFNITTVSTNLTVNIVMQTLDSSATTSPPPLNLYIRGSLVQSRDVTLPGLCRNMSIVNSFNSTCLTANISVTLMNTTSQFEYCSVLGMYGACISRHIAEKYLEVCSQDDMIYWLVESAPNLRNLSRIYDPLSCIPQTTVSPHTTQAYAQCNDADWIQQQMGAHCSAALDIFNRTQSQDDRCRIYTDTLGCLVVSWGMRQINCSINDVARVIAAKDFSMFVSTASTFNASLCYSGSGGLPTAAPLTGNLCEHPNVIAYHSLYTCPTNFTMDQHSTNETLCRKYQIQLTCVDNEMRMSNCSFNQMKKTFDMHLAENMPHIGGSVDVKFCDGLPNNTCSSFMYGDRRLLYRCGVYYVLGALFKGLNTPPNVCIPMGESLECLYRDSVQKNLTCSKEELADSSVMWLQSLHTLTKGYEPSTPNISKQNYTSCLNETIKQADFGNGTQAEDHRALVLMGLNCMADKFHNGVNCGDIPGIMSCWQNTHQSLVGYVYDITVYATALQKEVMFIKDYLKYDLTPCFVK